MLNFLLIILFVSLGMLFRRFPAFPRETPQVLNMFALYVSMPALILLKAPQLVMSGAAVLPAAVAWAILLLSATLVLVAARVAKWPPETVGVLLLLVPLGNTSFLGVPVIQAFFGAGGLPDLLVYDQFGTTLIFATYGSLILSMYGCDSSGGVASVLRRVLFFPPSLALAAGLALRGWTYPPQLAKTLADISLSLVPLVMTAIGFQLRFSLPRRMMKPLASGLGIKLIAAPLAALVLCRCFGAFGQAASVTVMEAGMPPMVTAGALAVVSGMEAELAVALVGVGIVVSFATLPMLYWLMRLP